MTEIIDGNAVAQSIRDDLGDAIATLEDEGVTPALATVLMSDDPASETYVSMKQEDCEEVGIEALDIEISPDADAAELYDTIEELNADDAVNGILVQMPVPEQVDDRQVLRDIDPALQRFELDVCEAAGSDLSVSTVRESTNERRTNGLPRARQTATVAGDRSDEWMRVENGPVVHLQGPDSPLDDEVVARQLEAKLQR